MGWGAIQGPWAAWGSRGLRREGKEASAPRVPPLLHFSVSFPRLLSQVALLFISSQCNSSSLFVVLSYLKHNVIVFTFSIVIIVNFRQVS